MKTGKIGLFTIAIGLVVALILLARLVFVPSSQQQVQTLAKAIKNTEIASVVPDFGAKSEIQSIKVQVLDNKKRFIITTKAQEEIVFLVQKEQEKFVVNIVKQKTND